MPKALHNVNIATLEIMEQFVYVTYFIYTSNLAGKRFQKQVKSFVSTTSKEAESINHNKTYQIINGFGGTFTDATNININSLDSSTKDHLMRYTSFAEAINLNQQ